VSAEIIYTDITSAVSGSAIADGVDAGLLKPFFFGVLFKGLSSSRCCQNRPKIKKHPFMENIREGFSNRKNQASGFKIDQKSRSNPS
jgi:hypothetical protein